MSDERAHRFLFYAGEAAPSSETVEVTGAEHHHMTRVLRMPLGEIVYATNGRGLILRCRIESLDGSAGRLGVLGVEERLENPRPVTLALAVLRKDAFERAVEQCTELGITACLPFVSERSHLKSYTASFIDRLRRVAFSAAKQSFRSLIPEIEAPVAFEDLLSRVRGAALALVGDAEGETRIGPSSGGPLVLIVGPEGGLSGAERAALGESGARFAAVSRHRLRSETAAAALVCTALGGESIDTRRGILLD